MREQLLDLLHVIAPKKVNKLKYLISTVQEDGDCEGEIKGK